MIIQWFGQACFKIQGDKASVVTDPFNDDYGLKLPRLTSDILTISHNHGDHNNKNAVKSASEGNLFVIEHPGEYEIKDVFIYGIPSHHDEESGAQRGSNVIYRFEFDGISIAHLGDLGHVLENGQIEKLEGIDILLIPVGGNFTINGKQATQIISQLEPRIVIPMHYQIPGLSIGGGKKIDNLDPFCKEIGVCPKEILPKFKITKKDLPQEDLQVVLLSN